MKSHLIAIIVTIFIFGCKIKQSPQILVKNFSSFEISYTSEWTRDFSFRVDSNKIFFSPKADDTVVYGILPDSIFTLIDTTIRILIKDENFKSREDGCVDCPTVALKAIIGKDTIKVIQDGGEIHKRFWPIIKTLQSFLSSCNCASILSIMFFETRKMVSPPLTPVTNFHPPKN